MRIILFSFILLLTVSAKAQQSDTAYEKWLTTIYLKQYSSDTGIYLAHATFINDKGKKMTLADFKGKIVYLNIWSTECPNSINKFPYEEQLLNRLKAIHLDSSILFVNLCTDDSKKDWKKLLKEHKPIGVNLYCLDTTLDIRWAVKTWPTYLLLDATGKVMGNNIATPEEAGTIDYILYAATKGINPVDAVMINYKLGYNYRQGNPMRTNLYSDEITKDFYAWQASTFPSFINFNFWRMNRQKQLAHQ